MPAGRQNTWSAGLRGLGVSLVAIVGIMALTLRSLKLALIAAIPNALPIFLLLGILGWIGLPLDTGMSVVGCLVLGLGVDDTAHVVGHLRRDESLHTVYTRVGPPLILTTLVLGLGFAVLILSEMQPVRMLGLGASLTLVVALVNDLLLLPSLLVLAGFEPGPGGSSKRSLAGPPPG